MSTSDDPRPLTGYSVLSATFVTGLTTALALTPSSRLRRRPSVADIVLIGVATSALSRLVTKDAVTAPWRKPFTEFDGPAGAGEVHEHPRGKGLRHAIGELVTCPFCFAPWAASALFVASVHAPRTTRFIASVLAGTTISNVVNQAYAFLRKSSRGLMTSGTASATAPPRIVAPRHRSSRLVAAKSGD